MSGTWTLIPALATDAWWGLAYYFGTIYASDANGVSRVLKSVDGGLSWTETGAVDLDFADFTVSNSTGYLFGARNPSRYIKRSTDNGNTWKDVGNSGSWYAIDATYGTDVYAVIYDGGIWKSSDNGTSWSVCTGAGTKGWTGVCTSPSGNVYAVSYDENILYMSSDAGATWSPLLSSPGYQMLRVRCGPSGKLYLTVPYSANIFESVDGGATWANITEPGVVQTSGFRGIAFESATSVLFSGDTLYRWAPPTPVAPSIYPPTGTYNGVQLAVIRSASPVYYTLDGSTPTTSSTLYTGPIRISQDSVLRAVAYSSGLYSPVSEAVYLLKGADYQRIPSYSDALLPKLLYQYQGDNP